MKLAAKFDKPHYSQLGLSWDEFADVVNFWSAEAVLQSDQENGVDWLEGQSPQEWIAELTEWGNATSGSDNQQTGD